MAPPDPADDPRLVAWAGVPLPKLCRAARDLGYSGLEKMAGVPGQLGGGIAMNAGGKDPDGTLWQMSDVVERIRLVGSDGEFRTSTRRSGRPSTGTAGWETPSWPAPCCASSRARGSRWSRTARSTSAGRTRSSP